MSGTSQGLVSLQSLPKLWATLETAALKMGIPQKLFAKGKTSLAFGVVNKLIFLFTQDREKSITKARHTFCFPQSLALGCAEPQNGWKEQTQCLNQQKHPMAVLPPGLLLHPHPRTELLPLAAALKQKPNLRSPPSQAQGQSWAL